MENQKPIKLSSPLSKYGLFFSAALIIAVTPFSVASAMKSTHFHAGLIIAPIIGLALIGFLVYLFMFSCDAEIAGNKLRFKKLFRPEAIIEASQIGYISSFRLKRTKFTRFEIKKENNIIEKAVILNSKSIFSIGKKDAEELLKEFKNSR